MTILLLTDAPYAGIQPRVPLATLFRNLFPILLLALCSIGTARAQDDNISVKTVEFGLEDKPSRLELAMAMMGQGGGTVTMQPLPDNRLLLGYRDEEKSDADIYALQLYSPTLEPVWSISHEFRSKFTFLGMTLEENEVRMLSVRYVEDQEKMHLLRTRFSAADGTFIACDTLESRPGLPGGMMSATTTGYALYRSPDNSKILLVQGEYRPNSPLPETTVRVMTLDRKFAITGERSITVPMSLPSGPNGPIGTNGLVTALGFFPDNDGGFYIPVLESGMRLSVSYYPTLNATPVTGAYRLDADKFIPLLDPDEPGTPVMQMPVVQVVGDRLLVSATVIEEPKDLTVQQWIAGLQNTRGFVSAEFPRSTMKSAERAFHLFDQAFSSRVLDDDKTESMWLTSATSRPDGTLVAVLEHAYTDTKSSTYTSNVGGLGSRYETSYSSSGVVDRLVVVHYDPSGKVKWMGVLDDEVYGQKVPNTAAPLLGARENLRGGEMIDLVGGYDESLRTLSFDPARDSIILGREVFSRGSKMQMFRRNVIWTSPSRLYVLTSLPTGFEYTLNLIETTDGTPLFQPSKE